MLLGNNYIKLPNRGSQDRFPFAMLCSASLEIVLSTITYHHQISFFDSNQTTGTPSGQAIQTNPETRNCDIPP